MDNIRSVANLITNMTLKGATDEELFRAIEFSTGIIDLERSKSYNRIDELVNKYGEKEVTT